MQQNLCLNRKIAFVATVYIFVVFISGALRELTPILFIKAGTHTGNFMVCGVSSTYLPYLRASRVIVWVGGLYPPW